MLCLGLGASGESRIGLGCFRLMNAHPVTFSLSTQNQTTKVRA